jgi:hypothetical protein
MASRSLSIASRVEARAAPMTTVNLPFASRILIETAPSSAGSSAISSSLTDCGAVYADVCGPVVGELSGDSEAASAATKFAS